MILRSLAAALLAAFAAAAPASAQPSLETAQASAAGLAARARTVAAAQAAARAQAAQEPAELPLPPALSMARAREVVPRVFLIDFPTQFLLASTFLRFQETYESPEFRGKVFTLEQFMDWYAAHQGKKGQMTYFTDWDGFNIPSTVLEPFRAGAFDPLTEKEKALLQAFASVPEPFYVIGTFGGKKSDSKLHEIAHGLYATNPEYRARVEAALAGADLAPLYKELADRGYNEAVFLDEAHAYLAEPTHDKGSVEGSPRYAALRRRLAAILADYTRDLR